ncbi:hypothetical protein EVAR_38327_1 [Eumeta japonica]|uniref:Ig-like domain-containing protein n=1 Tax=Eumeta variegata TaxID=151549 RepID=A0A4C1X7N8_EUMVA|nr:hypothetical protein EVAR_38327_1 [Eumeta japonica]
MRNSLRFSRLNFKNVFQLELPTPPSVTFSKASVFEPRVPCLRRHIKQPDSTLSQSEELKGSVCLRNVHILAPEAVKRGTLVEMRCHYDLEQETLYSVKWYRGDREFCRYSPREVPPLKVFPIPGIEVEDRRSTLARNPEQVVGSPNKRLSDARSFSSCSPLESLFFSSGYQFFKRCRVPSPLLLNDSVSYCSQSRSATDFSFSEFVTENKHNCFHRTLNYSELFYKTKTESKPLSLSLREHVVPSILDIVTILVIIVIDIP